MYVYFVYNNNNNNNNHHHHHHHHRSSKVCSVSKNRIIKVFTLVIFLRIKYRMEFRPQRQLRSIVIKNALKAYVVGLLTLKYQVCAVGSLDGVSKEKIMDNKTFTRKFAGGKSIRSLFFLLHNCTFRRKTWKEEPTIK